MAAWSYWNQILADVLINLLEQFILFLRVRFQQDIDQVIFQYPNAQCPVYHTILFWRFCGTKAVQDRECGVGGVYYMGCDKDCQ